MAHLLIPHRFNGPARSGNGGWTAGAVSELVADRRSEAGPRTVSVQLRQPPPLDVPLTVDRADTGAVTVSAHARPVAIGRVVESDPTPVAPVEAAHAAEAEKRYAGLHHHPFPTCFTCGTRRRPGDGLRIFPGPVPGRPDTVAATWTPYETSVPITWAALDCPGAWSSDVEERPVVLGTMTALVHELPSTSERYVVVAELRGIEGRKTFTASTLHGPDGRVLATAEHVWITIDPKDFA